MILGLDARDGRVAVRGWRETSAETVEQVLARFEALPLAALLHTDIGRDGLLGGPNVEATAALARRSKFPVLASGGVGSLDDLERLARTRVIAGAIVGKAIYSGRDPRRRSDRQARVVLTKRIIPCLDVKDGRVVKGVQFVDLVDAGDPVEVAAAYDAQGADELCFLDINASHENRGTMLELVTRTADRLTIPFSVGGGVRSVDDVRALLRAGADKVSVNSAAVARPELVRETAEKLGSANLIVAVDARRRDASDPGKAGRSTHTGVGARRASTPSSGRSAWKRSAPARSCSRAWIATARATDTTCHSRAQ